MAEHRTSADDIVPPWYKRGSYIILLAIIVFILIYALYLLVLAPHSGSPVNDTSTDCEPDCGDAGYLILSLVRMLGF